MKKSAMTSAMTLEHIRDGGTDGVTASGTISGTNGGSAGGAGSERARERNRPFENPLHPRKLADVEVVFTYYAQSVLGPLDVVNMVAQHLAGVWERRNPRQVLAEAAGEMMSVQFCSLHQVALGGRFWIHSGVEESGLVRAVVCRADETGVAAEEELGDAEEGCGEAKAGDSPGSDGRNEA